MSFLTASQKGLSSTEAKAIQSCTAQMRKNRVAMIVHVPLSDQRFFTTLSFAKVNWVSKGHSLPFLGLFARDGKRHPMLTSDEVGGPRQQP